METTMANKKTLVTAPSLASLDEYKALLQSAWDSGILTHNGPLLQRLEKELAAYFNLKNIVVLVNGTVAIQLPIRAMKLQGEIITTPFTWVATSSAIIWEGCRPVYVDIDPYTLNIDPAKIEAAITHKTSAILPVHVFSNPCDMEAIESIAKKHNLKVIYDAAHAVAVNYKGKSVMEYGDCSATSFHATKLYNTGEGGACITTNVDLHEQLKRLRFFGYDSNKEIVEDGQNGKMTEIHAALGLANLPYLANVCKRRKEIFEEYKAQLGDLDFLYFQKFNPESYNYSYMPVVFDTPERLDKVDGLLQANNIFGRRYFSPSLNTVKALGAYTPMPYSESIANRIMCLPSFTDLGSEKIKEICDLIREAY